MKYRIQYFVDLNRRFGFRAIFFLALAKLRKNRCSGIKIGGSRTKLHLSNFSTDVTTLFQVFFAKEYRLKNAFTPEFIIDCGANIGLSAVYFANQYPAAKIIAIEPDPGNFQYLVMNTAAYANIICLNKAVWSHPAELEIVDPGTGNWGLQTKESKLPNENKISSVTIDEILKTYEMEKIDLLKVDIEGAERQLFSANYENWLARTKVIAIELHAFIDPEIPEIFDKAISPFGFRKKTNGENIICER